MFSIKELAEFLVANDYAIVVNGKYKFTVKFHRDVRDALAGKEVPMMDSLQPNPRPAAVPAPTAKSVVLSSPAGSWEQRYKQFIDDAKVPVRCEGRNGDVYYTNRYSEDGMKAFKKAVESGINYELLVAATALYYRSAVRLKMAIGRFMEEGQWRSHYDELLQSAEEGKLKDHIEKTVDNGDFTFTQLG